MKTIRQAMMSQVVSGPSKPNTKMPPSTIRLSAAPGIISKVRRRRPTRSTIAIPTSIMTR